MSRRGNCHDNAVAESFFQLLRRERIKGKIYNHRDEARQDIFEYIELFYNSKRRHNSNNLLSQIDFENQFRKMTDACLQNLWRFTLVGACMHLFMHDSWLIFPTAFVPALVGTVHGINGFLHLSDLSEDHASMANRLDKTRKEIKEFRSDPKKILELSKAVHQVLTNRDVQWVETAEKLGLKVG